MENFGADRMVGSFLKQGGITAFGLVFTTEPQMPDASFLFARWLLACPENEVQDRAAHAVITATCALGFLDREQAHLSFRVARDLAALVNKAAISP